MLPNYHFRKDTEFISKHNGIYKEILKIAKNRLQYNSQDKSLCEPCYMAEGRDLFRIEKYNRIIFAISEIIFSFAAGLHNSITTLTEKS